VTKAYVVTSGEYSDYHVVGVYLDKDKADARAESINKHLYYCGGAGVEEYECDSDDLRGGLAHARVEIGTDGNNAKCDWSLGYEDGVFCQLAEWPRGQKTVLVCDVIAKDEEHAIKIANERRTAWLLAGGAS
jgi:hypothetical protein